MKFTKIELILAMVNIFIIGLVLISWATYSHASERHHHHLDLTPPTIEKDCGAAGAMAAGQHQFYITSKKQLSVSGATRDDCIAGSVGTAFTHNQTLYSGQITFEEGGEVSGGVTANITF